MNIHANFKMMYPVTVLWNMCITLQMAALKEYLVENDPSYTSVPVNQHKVSNTPALSTVSEESNKTPKCNKNAPISTALDAIRGVYVTFFLLADI